MSKPENTITLTLNVGAEYKHRMERAMEKEWREANRKWGLSLGSAEKETVMEHAKRQLERKVAFFTRNHWEFGTTPIVVSVNSMGRGSAALELPSPEVESYDISLVRANDGWKVNQEPSSAIIPLGKFQEYLTEELITWARTAVFYGVASYVTH